MYATKGASWVSENYPSKVKRAKVGFSVNTELLLGSKKNKTIVPVLALDEKREMIRVL